MIGFLRRLLDLHLELVDEVERTFAADETRSTLRLGANRYLSGSSADAAISSAIAMSTSPGGGGVADGGDRADPVDPEVVDEGAVGVERLGADSRRGGDQSEAVTPGRSDAPRRANALLLREPSSSCAPVRQCLRASARNPGSGASRQVADANVPAAVALAGEREHRVRADVDAASDASG